MLQKSYLLAKIGPDTAENERNFAENLPNFATTLREQTRNDLAMGLRGGARDVEKEVASPRQRCGEVTSHISLNILNISKKSLKKKTVMWIFEFWNF